MHHLQKTGTIFTLRVLFMLFAGFSTISCHDSPSPQPAQSSTALAPFILGVDLSYVNQIEDQGGTYWHNSQRIDPYEWLAGRGANLARIRLWHQPQWVHDLYNAPVPLYSGFSDARQSIIRAHEAGMSALLDFHYSDTWADPGHQQVPEAWQEITDIQVLTDSIYAYTYQVLHALYQRGHLPEMVQLGNETNCGMLQSGAPAAFPNLNVCKGHWVNYGLAVNAGIQAVRNMEALSGQSITIALHVADPKHLRWWVQNALTRGQITDFDVIGVSYYPHWHTEVAFEQLPRLIQQITDEFNKKVLIMETAYPFTTDNADAYGNIIGPQTAALPGYPFSMAGQQAFLQDLAQGTANAGGLGLIYWEPAWISAPITTQWGTGSAWENCAFFDFRGHATTASQYLQQNYLSE